MEVSSLTLATETTDSSDFSFSAILSRTTLGNLGSSVASCGASTLTGTIVLNCNYGELQEIDIFGEEEEDSTCDDFGADLEVEDEGNCYYENMPAAAKTNLDTAFEDECEDE